MLCSDGCISAISTDTELKRRPFDASRLAASNATSGTSVAVLEEALRLNDCAAFSMVVSAPTKIIGSILER